jgi:hypothetical protein
MSGKGNAQAQRMFGELPQVPALGGGFARMRACGMGMLVSLS